MATSAPSPVHQNPTVLIKFPVDSQTIPAGQCVPGQLVRIDCRTTQGQTLRYTRHPERPGVVIAINKPFTIVIPSFSFHGEGIENTTSKAEQKAAVLLMARNYYRQPSPWYTENDIPQVYLHGTAAFEKTYCYRKNSTLMMLAPHRVHETQHLRVWDHLEDDGLRFLQDRYLVIHMQGIFPALSPHIPIFALLKYLCIPSQELARRLLNCEDRISTFLELAASFLVGSAIDVFVEMVRRRFQGILSDQVTSQTTIDIPHIHPDRASIIAAQSRISRDARQARPTVSISYAFSTHRHRVLETPTSALVSIQTLFVTSN